ncbi:hypothetical protein RF11_09079 [Thelohanellus kitauei]|uniref:Uncharacterized protein n=1 Tax=Thelohanellus kitauei TaxID=669202 RepID=A0A0C2N8B8_THEKT|nr:hypothetical protein RF11_09079 [Thelohanellus kitauei]
MPPPLTVVNTQRTIGNVVIERSTSSMQLEIWRIETLELSPDSPEGHVIIHSRAKPATLAIVLILVCQATPLWLAEPEPLMKNGRLALFRKASVMLFLFEP